MSYRNIVMHGAFENPKDLQNIYSKIDISIVCYDTTSGNVRIAEPNKLYESIFFKTPIIVSSGTFLEDRVKEYNAGYAIDASKDNCIIEFVKSMTKDDIDAIMNNMNNVSCSELIDSSEELVKRINEKVNESN